ncbi:MAG: hypothetical protein P4M07_15740 [Xanthobacteraceae bacterium]|nr:hypothetical protein [Xanthobacteraceae bacterium]
MDPTSQPLAQASPGVDAATGRNWLVLAAVVAAAVALRQVVVANTDVSWLLTVGEKVLAGQALYRDVIETNPPIAMLAYLPGLVLGRALHVRAETVIDVLTFAAIAASMLVTIAIARRTFAIDPARAWPVAIFTVAVLAILPMQTFSQREHLALIALLPALAALVARGNGAALPAWAVAAASLGCAITLAFKPYFVLGIGAGIVTAALHARSWRVLFAPEHLIAAVLVALYGAFTAVAYPDYFTTVYPMVRDIYIPMKRPFAELVASPGVAVWLAALVLALVLRPFGWAGLPVAVITAESAGFAAAYALQQKGWAYQSYPMIALALIALAFAIAGLPTPARGARPLRAGAMALAVVLFVGGATWMNDTSDAGALIAPVARLGPHPRILILTGEASIGHPLVRAVNGTWVSGQQDLWVHEFVARIGRERALDETTRARFATYEAEERARLIDDIRRMPPDVLLIDNLLDDWGAWLNADPELSELLKPFHRVETVQKIDILARDD